MLWNGIKPITSLTKHRQRPKYPEPWRNALGSKGKIAAHMHDGRHKRCEGRPTYRATVQSKLHPPRVNSRIDKLKKIREGSQLS